MREIRDKITKKVQECNDFENQIQTSQSELSKLNQNYEEAIKLHDKDLAMKLTLSKQQKVSEINALKQILHDTQSTPAVSESELQAYWKNANVDYNEEIEQIYAQLKDGYDTFQEALNSLLSTRKDAHELALLLLQVAKSEKLNFVPENQFQRKSCIEFWDRKVNFKLNCLDHKITAPIDL